MLKISPPLVLASSSPYKKALLSRLRLAFTTADAQIDETRAPGESPLQMAKRLARQKAQALATTFPDHLILGSDQLIALGDQIFQKPKTAARAVEQLLTLQGKTHTLINAICLVNPDGQTFERAAIVEMQMRPLTRRAIEAYVALDQPLDCSGSYRIESAGIRLFQSTGGNDPTAIEGLPLIDVWDLLILAGVVDE